LLLIEGLCWPSCAKLDRKENNNRRTRVSLKFFISN
jgi:hypothetical protein